MITMLIPLVCALIVVLLWITSPRTTITVVFYEDMNDFDKSNQGIENPQ